jgi:hypothetical protein
VLGSPSQDQAAGLERLKELEEKLARARAGSRRLKLIDAIRIEADAYRKSLDAEQAKASQSAKPGPPFVLRLGRGRASALRRRSAPRR